MPNKAVLGAWGELQAAAYLKRKRYRLVAKNYLVRGAEVDLIVENRNYLVFVEVKTRQAAAFAEAREFVDSRKQARIRMAASLWLANNETNKQPRFDVVGVYAPEGIKTRKPQIHHWENAF